MSGGYAQQFDTLDGTAFESHYQLQNMIVCMCHPTSDRDVDAVIDEGARTVEDIGRRCGAGTGCGACIDDLRERLSQRGAAGCSRECDRAPADEDAAQLVAIRAR
jgi:bacterioferritin-associated ferredoxin